MPKKSGSLFLIGLLGLVGLVFLLTFTIASQKQKSESRDKSKQTTCVGKPHQEYSIVIQNNQMNPPNLEAKLCDRLTISNLDGQLRLLAFGEHEKHISYDGIVEKQLKNGQSFSIELNQLGKYGFHDHFQEEVQARFTVAE